MRFARVRSGLAESFDEVIAVAIDPTKGVVYESGDIDQPMYYRSAIKPLQALAGRRVGLELPPEHLALTCASHGGWPVHISSVKAILQDADLSEAALGTPPSRPSNRAADAALIVRGDTARRPIMHDCSGKHAGWLAACVREGWDPATYLDPEHPLQQSIVDIVTEYTGIDPTPVGVDGCGAPTLVGSVRGLATGFASLGTVDELAPIADAMTRFGAMTSDNIFPWGRVAVVWGGPSKGGAAGCFAMVRQGIAIAAKSQAGSAANAVTAALHVADRLGLLPDAMQASLQPELRPEVIGGGRGVGHLELVEA